MPKRPLTAVLAALALLAAAPAAARAQDPPADATPEVERIYDDYSDNGVIDSCKHTLENLQLALDTIEPSFDETNPDFRAAVEAGISDHFTDSCNDAGTEPTATPGATTAPSATPDSGTLPPDDGGGGDTGAIPPPVDDGTLPPDDGTLAPEATAAPPAATPAPPAAATTPAAAPTPVIVSRSGTDGLLIPGILIGLALLGAAALGAFALASRRSPRFEHAWREAALRTRGTWADFSDWLRFGR